MRTGFLLFLGALWTSTGLALAQLPYPYPPGYPPAPPAYGYYAPPTPYGSSPVYPVPYGYQPAYQPAVPPATPPAAPPPPNRPAAPAIKLTQAESPPPPLAEPIQTQPLAEPIQTQPTEEVPSTPLEVSSPAQEGPELPAGPPEDPPTATPENPLADTPENPPGVETPLAVSTSSPPATPAPAPAPAKQPGGVVTGTPNGLVSSEGVGFLKCVLGELLGTPADATPRSWYAAEPMLWWFRRAPLDGLVVTQTPAGAVGPPGVLGAPGVQVVSPHNLSLDRLGGGRLTLGSWLDDQHRFGVEVSGFATEALSRSVQIANDQNGNPLLSLAFLRPVPVPTETALTLNVPGLTMATVVISSTAQLWSSEVNGLYHAMGNDWYSVGLLAGFRYLDLREKLTFANNQSLLGGPVFTTNLDSFATRNQFYGVQVGGRGELRYNGLFANLTAKLALGDVHESVTINGTGALLVNGVLTPFPGGILAPGSNIGRQTHETFAAVSEAQVQAGYEFNRFLRVYGGYTFLFVSSVLRPGDQVDRVLNLPQVNGLPVNGGPARPISPDNSTYFWAHGISAGVELRY